MGSVELSNCDNVREQLDSYISNELEQEAKCEVQRHLACCPDCKAELKERGRIKAALHDAVRRDATPPFLQAKIRKRLEELRRRQP